LKRQEKKKIEMTADLIDIEIERHHLLVCMMMIMTTLLVLASEVQV